VFCAKGLHQIEPGAPRCRDCKRALDADYYRRRKRAGGPVHRAAAGALSMSGLRCLGELHGSDAALPFRGRHALAGTPQRRMSSPGRSFDYPLEPPTLPERVRVSGFPPLMVAVGKTPGAHAGSLVRVGSENGHLVRRTQAVRCEDVVHAGSEVHLRTRAARFLERLYPTATSRRSTARLGCWSPSFAGASGLQLTCLRLVRERA
jgi:hypothetical protein